MRVLVTGATGFIGRHLVRRLMKAGEQVRVFARPTSATAWLNSLGAEIVLGDIADLRAVERAVRNCQLAFHLAAKTTSSGLLSSKDVRATNIYGTENIATAAAQQGIDRVVFSSTVSVYGRTIRNRLIDEKTDAFPDSPYGHSKLAAEQVLLSRSHDGLPVVVARISTVWGPGNTSWQGLFRSIASGQFRTIGDGKNHHPIADVEDIVEGLLLCGSVKGIEGQTYLLAGNEPVQLQSMVTMIGEEVGVTQLPRNLPSAPLKLYRGLDKASCRFIGRHLPRADRITLFLADRGFNITRARKDLGYAPQISARATIHRMVEWYRTEGLLPSRG